MKTDEEIREQIQRRHFVRRTTVEPKHALADPEWTEEETAYLERQRLRREKRRVLHQTEHWWPMGAVNPIRIEDMSLQYKKNVLAFLERRAGRLHVAEAYELVAGASMMNGEHARDSVERIADEVMSMKPVTWLYSTPFMSRLEQLIREGHDGPID